MSMCRIFSCVVGRGCLLWPVCSLGKTLLAFALLHSAKITHTHTHTQTKCFCILYIYLFLFILLVQSHICSFFFPISYYTVAVAQPTFDTTKIRKLLVPLIGHTASISTFSGNGYWKAKSVIFDVPYLTCESWTKSDFLRFLEFVVGQNNTSLPAKDFFKKKPRPT